MSEEKRESTLLELQDQIDALRLIIKLKNKIAAIKECEITDADSILDVADLEKAKIAFEEILEKIYESSLFDKECRPVLDDILGKQLADKYERSVQELLKVKSKFPKHVVSI